MKENIEFNNISNCLIAVCTCEHGDNCACEARILSPGTANPNQLLVEAMEMARERAMGEKKPAKTEKTPKAAVKPEAQPSVKPTAAPAVKPAEKQKGQPVQSNNRAAEIPATVVDEAYDPFFDGEPVTQAVPVTPAAKQTQNPTPAAAPVLPETANAVQPAAPVIPATPVIPVQNLPMTFEEAMNVEVVKNGRKTQFKELVMSDRQTVIWFATKCNSAKQQAAIAAARIIIAAWKEQGLQEGGDF